MVPNLIYAVLLVAAFGGCAFAMLALVRRNLTYLLMAALIAVTAAGFAFSAITLS
jgi:hypothetical protein